MRPNGGFATTRYGVQRQRNVAHVGVQHDDVRRGARTGRQATAASAGSSSIASTDRAASRRAPPSSTPVPAPKSTTRSPASIPASATSRVASCATTEKVLPEPARPTVDDARARTTVTIVSGTCLWHVLGGSRAHRTTPAARIFGVPNLGPMAEMHDTTEEYLESILAIEEEGVVPMRARLVERLGLSAAAVSETIGRLSDHGYVELHGDRSLHLTDKGRSLATTVVRRHRLAERLLVDVIGLEWEKVHREADRWEHAISADVEEKLVVLLGDPATCPHGNPIPGSKNAGQRAPTVPLARSADRARHRATRQRAARDRRRRDRASSRPRTCCPAARRRSSRPATAR